MAAIDVRHLGDFIRDQRRDSNVSLRQLAKLAGVSNPYLSQIERGLRKPSAEILQQIAKALRISAEALYVQAGILEQREGNGAVPDAVLADEALNERQKQVLLEIYDSFRKENAAANAVAGVSSPGGTEPLATTSAVKKAAKKATNKAVKRPAKKAAASPEPSTTAPTPPTPVPNAPGGTA